VEITGQVYLQPQVADGKTIMVTIDKRLRDGGPRSGAQNIDRSRCE